MRTTWRKQKTEPDYTYDTPVPSEASPDKISIDDTLAASMGELGPREFAE